MTKQANREFKDGVFRKFFSEEDNLRSLYCALSGRAMEEIEEIEIVTLDNVLFGVVKNDLSFTIGVRFIIMIEHMSYDSDNIPLTMLKYFLEQIERKITNKQLHQKKRIKFPAPEFYVLYNGEQKNGGTSYMKLSDSFEGIPNSNCTLALDVKVIDINYDENNEFLQKCDVARQYSMFIDKIREEMSCGQTKENAIKNAVRYCTSNGIMVDFLQKHESEVEDMLLEPMTAEEIAEARYEEGIDLGKDLGRKQAIRESALKFKASGTPIDVISGCLGMSKEEIEKL